MTPDETPSPIPTPATCEAVRPRLLDHVYEALDEAESLEIERHLAGCAACRAALDAARAMQGVLATAARSDADDVVFTEPADDPRNAAAAAVAVDAAVDAAVNEHVPPTAGPRPRLIPRAWWKTLAAAAVLGAAWTGVDAVMTRSRAVQASPVFEVDGPAVVARGVPAEYRVTSRTVDGTPLPARIEARMAKGAENHLLGTAEIGADRAEAAIAFDPAVLDPGAVTQVWFWKVGADADGDGTRATPPAPPDEWPAARHGASRAAPPLATVSLRESTRLLSRVSTDKPLYRPGETIRMRGVALESLRLTPAGDTDLRLRLLDPKGAVAFDTNLPTLTGVTAFEHALPEDAAGGTWKLVLSGVDGGNAGAVAQSERTFRVRSYRAPRLRFDWEFDRASYRLGEKGTAFLRVKRAEGGIPVGAKTEATLLVDGDNVASKTEFIVHEDGGVAIPFDIANATEEGSFRLAVTVHDGGAVESVVRTIPVVTDVVRFESFPEGGTLVAGLENRVYFRTKTPAGAAADLDAELRDGAGSRVAAVKSDVRGMGTFEFTPKAGETYRVVDPATGKPVAEGATLTAAASGTTLRTLDDEVAAKGTVRVRVGSTAGGRHMVGAWCRGVPIGEATVDVPQGGTADASIRLRTEVGGVLRVTAFDARNTPVAERLVSRRPVRRLDVAVAPSRAKTAPRQAQEISVRVTDETGAPAQAILGAAVVDASVLSLADDRDTAPMAFHYLVGMEVDELEEAAVYTDGPDAARAVDRLLGVQGWRRFAWKDAAAFAAAHPDSGPRVAPVGGADRPVRWSNADEALGEVNEAVDESLQRSAAFAVLGAVGVLFLGGIAVGARALWQHRKLAAAGAFTVPVAIFTFIAIAVSQVRCGNSFMERAMPGAAMDVVTSAVARVAGVKHDAKGEKGLATAEEEFSLPDLVELDDVDNDAEQLALRQGNERIRRLAELPKPRPNEPGGPAKPPGLGGLGYLGGRSGEEAGDTKSKSRRAEFLVREFAHRAAASTGVRDDFAEVLAWCPLLVTDEKGEAKFSFDTSDSLTSFSVQVDAHDGRGALGSGGAEFSNRIPFFAEPKFPLALTAGDEVDLPVVVANDSDAALEARVRLGLAGDLLAARGGGPAGAVQTASVLVAPGARGRVLLPLTALQSRGAAGLDLEVSGGPGLLDRSRRTIDVHPRGFPIAVNRSGLLEEAAATTLVLPDRLNRITLRGGLRIYPSTLATLVDGLDAMLQEPHGCFEQASSSNYPNVLVLNYLQDQRAATPEVAGRARDLLATGYTMLKAYECASRGYEWFGKDPGHTGLTAYGILEFADMAKVYAVDAAMVTRTRDWLVSRRDAEGSYEFGEGHDGFAHAPREVSDSYVAWALSEADATTDLTKEMALLESRVREGKDPYLVALAANVFQNRGHAAAKATLDRLASLQRADGGFDAKGTSITQSVGKNLEIETTALAAAAFAKSPERLANGEAAVRFLLASRQGGRFGATQATILALRALTAHAKASRRTATDHDLRISVNGVEVAAQSIVAGTPGVVEVDAEILAALVPGENRIEMRTTGAEALPWSLAVEYSTDLPATDEDCAIGIETSLATTEAKEGGSVTATVVVRNRRDEPQAMTLARFGVPAGLEPRAERLEELKKAGEIDFFELRPREVVLYWRGMKSKQERHLSFDLTAAIPGRFEGPASSAYLYYGDDRKAWAAPLRATVK